MTGVGTSFTGIAADPTRVASQVITGIGFIGAGVILKNGGSITGLTTAATLWVSAGVGVAVGAELFAPAVGATIIAMAVTLGLRLVKPLTARGRRTLKVGYQPGHGTIGPLLRRLHALDGSVDKVSVEDDGGDRHVSIEITSRDEKRLDEILEFLRQRPEVDDAVVIPRRSG
jgi:putative Mg2+ transporter-C (MgtC) family protein